MEMFPPQETFLCFPEEGDSSFSLSIKKITVFKYLSGGQTYLVRFLAAAVYGYQ